MTHNVAIRIPATRQKGGQIDLHVRETAVRRIAVKFATQYGGCETNEIRGFYVHADGRLVDERVTVISAFCESVDRPPLEALASQLCYDLDQECVALVIDGEMTFHGRTDV